jgi:hypothetical protein
VALQLGFHALRNAALLLVVHENHRRVLRTDVVPWQE